MLTVRVFKGTEQHRLELYKSDPVNLKYRSTTIEKIQRQAGGFSQQFRIPATKVNAELFGAFFDPNQVEGYNAKAKVEAVLEYNTVPIMYGFIQLKGVVIQHGRYSEYKVVFFGESISFARDIGDKKLADIDLSSYDHISNYANVTGSWSGSLFSGEIRYGIIDRGRNWNAAGGTPMNSASPIYPGEMTPFLQARKIVEAIFEDAGYELDSDFISGSDFDDFYVPFMNGETVVQSEQDLENSFFAVGATADESVSATGLYQIHDLNIVSEASPFYDPEDVVSSGIFTPLFSGFYRFKLNIPVENTSVSENVEIRAVIRDSTSGLILWASSPVNLAAGDTHTFYFADNTAPVIQLDTSNDITLAVEYTMYGSATFSVLSDGTLGSGGCYFQLVNFSDALSGQTVSMQANAPDIKQIEFLLSLQAMFNLVFIPDKLNPKKITVEPMNSYLAGGEVKDWSDLLDTKKDIVIDPTTDIQKREYEWSYEADKDLLNEIYINEADRIFGRYLVEDTGNDFAVGEQRVQCKFGAYPMNTILGTSVLIHKSIRDDGSAVKKPLCKFVFWGGEHDGEWHLYDESSANIEQQSTYPYFGHYSVPNPDVTDKDLNFGAEVPLHTIVSNPYDNLYNTYWADYVNELYSEEARIMTCYVKLSEVDIYNFRYNDRLYLFNSYWRILELDYSPSSRSLSKVKLRKALTSPRQCAEIPYSVGVGGEVNFIDADGNVGAPSAECCEQFGYVVISGKCYQQQPTGGNDDDGGQVPSVPTGAGSADPVTDSAPIRGAVFAQGSHLQVPPGINGIVIGDDITIERQSYNALAIGSSLQVTAPNVLATGNNVDGFVEGVHRGGGWWYENFRQGEFGVGQSGQVTFIYEGAFDQKAQVELFIEGKENRRLEIPVNTAWAVRMDVLITTEQTGNLFESQLLTFYDIFTKDNLGKAENHYAAHTNTPTENIGDLSSSASSFDLDIDVTTDSSQHRVLLHNKNVRNANQTRIVCVLNYQMSRY